VLVVLGAARVGVDKVPVAGPLFRYYGAITGADRQFGFFAPAVGTQLRAEFDLVDKNGQTQMTQLEAGVNRESQLRIGNLVSLFWDKIEDETLRRTMAASMAAKMFNRFPETQSVAIRFEGYELPPMRMYAEGARPFWKPFYRAKFSNE